MFVELPERQVILTEFGKQPPRPLMGLPLQAVQELSGRHFWARFVRNASIMRAGSSVS